MNAGPLKRLTVEERGLFDRYGIAHPIEASSSVEVASHREKLADFLAPHEWPLDLRSRHDVRPYLEWVSGLVRTPPCSMR